MHPSPLYSRSPSGGFSFLLLHLNPLLPRRKGKKSLSKEKSIMSLLEFYRQRGKSLRHRVVSPWILSLRVGGSCCPPATLGPSGPRSQSPKGVDEVDLWPCPSWRRAPTTLAGQSGAPTRSPNTERGSPSSCVWKYILCKFLRFKWSGVTPRIKNPPAPTTPCPRVRQ